MYSSKCKKCGSFDVPPGQSLCMLCRQAEIDDEIERQHRIIKSDNAKEKLITIYKSILGFDFHGELETLEDIDSFVSIIERDMEKTDKYYDDVIRLRSSLDVKLKK